MQCDQLWYRRNALALRTDGSANWGRLGKLDEIAAIALLMASDEESFMTGSSVVMDGGMSLQSSEPSSFQTPLVALDIVGASRCQTELPLMKFPTDHDEALLFGFIQRFQARAFRGRLPIHAIGAVQQYHYLDNYVSPWLMHKTVLCRFTKPPVPLS